MQIIIRSFILVAIAILLSFGSVSADVRGLPADKVIAAIQTAVAVYPGLIKEVEVERKHGRLIVEVKIIRSDGAKVEVKVDPENNALLR